MSTPLSPQKIILDVLGGDYGTMANLDGAQQALPQLRGELVLIGDEKTIRDACTKRRFKKLSAALEGKQAGLKISIVHSDQTIEMEDSIKVIRSKTGASINVGCKIASEDWKAGKPSAFISAGHSGAMMASALLTMGRLKGIERPAIAVTLPSIREEGCVLLDVGANVDCKPQHLRDFAVMGALFAQVENASPDPTTGKKRLPRVGLLSNGEELSKGNELTRAALELIQPLSVFKDGPDAIGQFVGYSEGKEIFKGQVDVVVTDGFVGNVVLKSLEGLGSTIIDLFKAQATQSTLSKLGAALGVGFLLPVLTRMRKKLDYAEYGAAPLLGVAGYAFICHGRSKGKAIKNALWRAQSALQSRFLERLRDALESGILDSAPTKKDESSKKSETTPL